MQKLNKRDLIEEVSEKAHISKKDAENAIEVAFNEMEKALLEGREVNITNFGSFLPKERKSRVGTDPKTHERITIEGNNTVVFKMSRSFKEKINK